MDVKGQETLAAPPEEVWRQLTDPVVLKSCIPGCKVLEEDGEGTYRMEIELGIAAVKGRYQGRVEVRSPEPPHGYTLHIEAQGSPGYVHADIPLRLAARGQGTELSYTGEAQVGGLIAGVGQRMISGVAKIITRQFFDAFARQISTDPATP